MANEEQTPYAGQSNRGRTGSPVEVKRDVAPGAKPTTAPLSPGARSNPGGSRHADRHGDKR
jgi:hypothetical protein